MILVSNKNADAQIQLDLINYDSDFHEDDIMNEPQPFDPPYVYQRKDMFKFFYHIWIDFDV